jgi:hypothetical protein
MLMLASSAMAASTVEYSIYCVTESQWVSVITNVAPTNCPNNPAHTVKANSVRVSNANPNYDLIPTTTNSSVGLPDERFVDGYFEGESVYVGDEAVSETSVSQQQEAYEWGILEGYVSGYTMTYSNSNTVVISAGKAANSSNTMYITSTTSLVADITQDLDGGNETSNWWYYVYVAQNTNGVAVPVFVKDNIVTPNSYTNFRRVGWVRNDENQDFIPFEQRWDGKVRRMMWDTANSAMKVLQAGSSTNGANINLKDAVPPTGRNAMLTVKFKTGATGAATDCLRLKPVGAVNWIKEIAAGVVSDEHMLIPVELATDGEQKIRYKVDASVNRAALIVEGYDDEL